MEAVVSGNTQKCIDKGDTRRRLLEKKSKNAIQSVQHTRKLQMKREKNVKRTNYPKIILVKSNRYNITSPTLKKSK
jgi:hypothetical protein